MTEDGVLPVGEGALEIPPRRRWWVPLLVLLLAGALLAVYIPGLLPEERTGSGTGFAIRDGGYILTAAHVVQGATEIVVRWEGHSYRATTIALSAAHDLALLLAEDALPIPAAALASDRPRFGDRVTAVGHPTGAAQPVALSTHVSGVGGWAVGPEGVVLRDLIATQDPFQPGYSGAPLVNEAGQVVGIVTGSVTSASGQEYGFAVSIHRAADWLAGRGMILPLQGGSPAVVLSEADQVDAIRPAVVRVEARFPPGAR
ncbi:trypsin-like peptidase domain-containing protein [Candidatus Bipolaricaulota bacterium]|nr:trypsin-like peptidase domain-containing protein [Candidatus Bipolaricaulota bacterium]